MLGMLWRNILVCVGTTSSFGAGSDVGHGQAVATLVDEPELSHEEVGLTDEQLGDGQYGQTMLVSSQRSGTSLLLVQNMSWSLQTFQFTVVQSLLSNICEPSVHSICTLVIVLLYVTTLVGHTCLT